MASCIVTGVSGVLLAAGQSRRMKQTKQLLPLNGQRILEVCLDNLCASRLDEIVVVLGHDAPRILPLLGDKPRIRVIINRDFRDGIGTSIREGVRQIAPQVSAVMVALGDQPFIPPEAVNALIDGWTSGTQGIVVPVYRGERGHPVLFSLPLYRSALELLDDDVGGRAIVQANSDDILEIPVSSPGVLLDIDTWEEYESFRDTR